MIAHILVNPSRPRPNTTLNDEIRAQGFDVKIWLCIDDANNVVRSINISHKQIVQFAADHHLPEICIMEEDVMFPAPDGWRHFLRNKPESFDLYLGGAYGLNYLALNRIQENPGAVEIHNFAGLHCYIISERYYQTFLSLPDDIHIDNQPGLGSFYVCAPFAALQHPGWSCNAKEMVDYNCDKRSLPPECIYYGQKDN